MNTAVIIADTNIEDSFDIQGYFIAKLPFDLDKIGKQKKYEISFSKFSIIVPIIPRRTLTELPQQQQQRPQPGLFTKRPPSESALRSMASTTTANTFVTYDDEFSRKIKLKNLF
jgi:hypothetical protein